MRLQWNSSDGFADQPSGRRLVGVNLRRIFTSDARQVPWMDDRCRIRAKTCVEAFSPVRAMYSDEIEQIRGDIERAISTDRFPPISEHLGQRPAKKDHVNTRALVRCTVIRWPASHGPPAFSPATRWQQEPDGQRR